MIKLCEFYKECKEFRNNAVVCVDEDYRKVDDKVFCGKYRDLSAIKEEIKKECEQKE